MWLRPIAVAAILPLVAQGEATQPAAAFTRTIYLVRHGAYDAHAKVDAAIGGDLTPLGIAQARLIAARLRGLPVHFNSLTSSTMARAEQTAASVHELLTEVPESKDASLSECTPPAFKELKGEPVSDQEACAKRLDAEFAQRFTPAPTADTNDIIVAHGNVIRYLVAKALNVDTRAWLGMSVAHTSLTVVRVRADGSMRVLAVGDLGHIPPNLQSWGTDSDRQLVAP
jgi:serine/threonine-protein phosphatase PGAM5